MKFFLCIFMCVSLVCFAGKNGSSNKGVYYKDFNDRVYNAPLDMDGKESNNKCSVALDIMGKHSLMRGDKTIAHQLIGSLYILAGTGETDGDPAVTHPVSTKYVVSDPISHEPGKHYTNNDFNKVKGGCIFEEVTSLTDIASTRLPEALTLNVKGDINFYDKDVNPLQGTLTDKLKRIVGMEDNISKIPLKFTNQGRRLECDLSRAGLNNLDESGVTISTCKHFKRTTRTLTQREKEISHQ